MITALAFELLPGVYQYRSQVRPLTSEAARILQMESVDDLKSLDNWKEAMLSALEQAYAEDLADYEEAMEVFDRRINNYKDLIACQRNYLHKSLIMQVAGQYTALLNRV